MMNKKSLIAKWIEKCNNELDKRCDSVICNNCEYHKACVKVTKLYKKFIDKGYID